MTMDRSKEYRQKSPLGINELNVMLIVLGFNDT